MSYHGACPHSVGSCPGQTNHCHRVPWYCKFIKPLFSFVISVTLALSMSHLCEKYSSSGSLDTIKSDLNTVRSHLSSLSNEVRTLVESRDEFKSKLKELACVMPKLSEAILQLKHEQPDGGESSPNSSDNLRDLVRKELEMYGADKTGKPDYALEASGATILSIRDTEPYTIGAPVLKLFGIPICPQQNTPRAVIQTGSLPGECWAFKGSRGSIVIQLLGEVRISEVSIEHISPAISPTGETSTAPRDFSAYGLKSADDKDGCLLGKFTYDNSGPPLQVFKVQNDPGRSYEIVEFKFHSNSGNDNYTCIYRIRVHGTLTSNTVSKN